MDIYGFRRVVVNALFPRQCGRRRGGGDERVNHSVSDASAAMEYGENTMRLSRVSRITESCMLTPAYVCSSPLQRGFEQYSFNTDGLKGAITTRSILKKIPVERRR